jgi:hypothetical protein
MPGESSRPWWQRWWAIAAAVVLVLIIIGSFSEDGSDRPSHSAASSATNLPSAKPTNSNSRPTKTVRKRAGSNLNPRAGVATKVKPGGAFNLGDFEIRKGWRVHELAYGMGYEINGLEVENLTSSTHQFSANIKLHKGAHRIVADMLCIANEARPSDIVEVDCLPDGSGKPFDYVTIENSF